MNSPVWIYAALAGLACFAISNVIDKILREKYVKNNLALMMLIMLRTGVFLLFVPFIQIEQVSISDVLVMLLSGGFWLVGTYFYIITLSFEEVSRVVPVWNTYPIFTLLLAFLFLGERLSSLQYVAFVFLLLGGIVISLHIKDMKNIRLSKAFYFMLFSSFSIASAVVLLKHLLLTQAFWTVFVIVNMTGFFIALPLLFFSAPRRAVVHDLSLFSKFGIMLLIIWTIASTAAVFFYNYAFLKGQVSVISSLDGFQSIFIFLFTLALSLFYPYILKEEVSTRVIIQKFIALGLLFAGLWILFQ